MRSALLLRAIVLGLSSSAHAEATFKKPHVYDSVRVLCVGIDSYRNRAIPDTPCSENDANEIGRRLSDLYRYTPDYLVGPRATRRAILGKLNEYSRTLTPNDSLIVFFAGHGRVLNVPPEPGAGLLRRHEPEAGFLVPYDFDADLTSSNVARWRVGAIEMKDLLERCEDLKARHVLIIADACCSGFMIGRGIRQRPDLQVLTTEASRFALAATTKNGTARHNPNGQHGYFTESLLESLDGREASSLTEVFENTRRLTVMKAGKDKDNLPQMGRFGDGDGEFVFLPDSLPDGVVRTIWAELQRTGRLRPGAPNPMRGVASRYLERAKLAVTPSDVFAAFEAPDYHFAEGAAEQEGVWEGRLARFEQAAACGDVLGMVAAHYCYARGLGTKIDGAIAFHWAKMAYESGTPPGIHALGRSFYYGIGVGQNEPEGLRLMRDAGKRGFPVSLIQLGIDHLQDGNLTAARTAWREAARAGVFSGSYYLGCSYLGVIPGYAILRGLDSDPQTALKILMPAANSGHVNSQMMVAFLYARSLDKADVKKARSWLEHAARQGHSRAQGWLAQELSANPVISGVLPLNLGLTPNQREAERWANMAIKQGDGEGHLALACLHEFGIGGLIADQKIALEHCRAAVDKNSPGAMVLLSMWYSQGRIVAKRDRVEATRLAIRAVESHDLRGYVWLASLYADGDVPVEFLRTQDRWNGKWVQKHHGLHYFTLAANLNNQTAIEAVKELAEEVRKDPQAPHWLLFKRIYPDSAREFLRLTKTPAK